MLQTKAFRPVTTATLALAISVLTLSGCQTTPAGSTGGRIDPYRTTAADRASRSANMPALLEFSDKTSQALVRDLIDIDEIQALPTKAVLELGDLNNKTRSSTIDFELIQKRIRSQLLRSGLIRDNFIVVENRRRMDRELDRVVGQSEDLLQEATAAGGTAKYDPNITFLLIGDFYESSRSGGVRRYYFEFKLTNLGSRQIVFIQSYDLGQQ